MRGPIQSLTGISPGVEANRLAAAAELLAEPTFRTEVKKLTAAETISNATRPAYLTNGGREAHYANWDVFHSFFLHAASFSSRAW